MALITLVALAEKTLPGAARRYESADEYATAMGSFGRSRTTDPPNVRERAEQEHRRLVERWNFWRQAGSI
jgi:hypothetical protein